MLTFEHCIGGHLALTESTEAMEKYIADIRAQPAAAASVGEPRAWFDESDLRVVDEESVAQSLRNGDVVAIHGDAATAQLAHELAERTTRIQEMLTEDSGMLLRKSQSAITKAAAVRGVIDQLP